MGGGSGRTTTTTTQAANEPWGPTQDYLKNNLANVQSFYQSPAANQTFQGSTVVPFARQSIDGLNQMEGTAHLAHGSLQKPLLAYTEMMNYASPRAQGNFYGDRTYGQIAGVRDFTVPRAVGNFENDPFFGQFDSLRQSNMPLAQGDFANDSVFGSTQQLRDSLMPMARGDFRNDPAFMSTLGRAQEDAAKQVNLATAAAGRYGSGVHSDRMVDTIGDMTNRAILERQNMALNQVGALNDRLQGGRQSAVGNYRGLTGDMSQGQQAAMGQYNDITNILGAAQNTAANQLMSFGNSMPSAYEGAIAPGQTLRAVGQQYENLAGNYAQERLDQFNAASELQRRNLAEQNALYSGIGAMGGQQSGSSAVRTPGMSGTQMAGLGLSTAGRLVGGK